MKLPTQLQNHERKIKVLNQWKIQKFQNEKRENFVITTWKTFCRQTSIHAMKYLTESSISLIEKILWALAIIFALLATVYSCMLLHSRFRSSLTSTVFESTNYKVSEIPFAAVTFCNNNRLNYSKTDEAVAKFLPNRSKNETETFIEFLKVLQNMDYGSFDEFEVIQGRDVSEINKLNISEVYEFLMHDCELFFVSCSWRNVAFNCCEWFSKQKSEYGICWSFNSFTSVGTKFVNVSFNVLCVFQFPSSFKFRN